MCSLIALGRVKVKVGGMEDRTLFIMRKRTYASNAQFGLSEYREKAELFQGTAPE